MSRNTGANEVLEYVTDPYYKEYYKNIADIRSLKDLLEGTPAADVKPNDEADTRGENNA